MYIFYSISDPFIDFFFLFMFVGNAALVVTRGRGIASGFSRNFTKMGFMSLVLNSSLSNNSQGSLESQFPHL